MEIISIIRVLWARRVWVVLGLALAVVAGIATTYHVEPGLPPEIRSRQYHVGVASLNVLIDTPSSQVADLRPPIGADVLGTRAQLFASLISTPPVQAIIAKRVGIPVSRLTTSPSGTAPAVPSPVANEAPTTADRANTYRLEVATQEALPIIGLTAEAPDAGRAALLANQTFEALKEYLVNAAEQQAIPTHRRPAVTAFGRASSADVVRGPGRIIGIAVALLVFGLVCVGIVVGAALARSWREAAALEELATAPGDEREPQNLAPIDIPPRNSADGERSVIAPERDEAAEHSAAGSRASAGQALDKLERLSSIGRRR